MGELCREKVNEDERKENMTCYQPLYNISPYLPQPVPLDALGLTLFGT